jgi:hypothetical protein
MPAAVISGGSAGVIAFPDLVTEEIPSGSFYTLHDDGSITHDADETGDLRWVINTAPTNYEVRLAGGSWLAFTEDRTVNATSQIELRDKYTTSIVKDVTVTFA